MNNWFDIVILGTLLLVFIQGYRKGLIIMAIELTIVILATIFGGTLANKILPKVEYLTNMSQQWANVVSYIVAFVAIALVLSMIGKIVQKLFSIINLNFLNRIGGGVLSMGISMIILSIIVNLILVLDKNRSIITPEIASKSFFFEGVQAVVPSVTPYLEFDIIDKIIPNNNSIPIEYINRGVIDSTYQKRYFSTD